MVKMNPPHIMIFANNYPNLEVLTLDRWDVRRIILTLEEKQIIEKTTAKTIVEAYIPNSEGHND